VDVFWNDEVVRPRSVMRTYQTVARAWLSAAVVSLALPAGWRSGIWLPLHLTVAGAATTAISGAMQNFAATLTATPAAPAAAVAAQLAALTAGVCLIAVGYPSAHPALTAAGGTSFAVAIGLLLWFVIRAWRRALNRRHRVPIAMYTGAVGCVLAGGAIGAALGSRVVGDPLTWLGLRSAHMVLNVLGFVSVTILATLVTLLPTVLRVQMPRWHGGSTAACLLAGAIVLAFGLGTRRASVATAGAVLFAVGVAGMLWLVVRVLRVPRTWPMPLTAKHVVAALGWFVVGSAALLDAAARGPFAFVAFREPFLACFVAGWTVQVLLGAWSYLLPMARPGHPDERRRQLVAAELGGNLEVVFFNLGVGLLAVHAAGWASGAIGRIGAAFALAAGGWALAKAWAFPVFARLGAPSVRDRAVWGA
jgi:nitrite reductase (NO-forming)